MNYDNWKLKAPESKGFTQTCARCHIEYDTAHSDAYRYEVYCSEECEDEYI